MVEGKNQTAEKSRDTQMVHRSAWDPCGQPSVVRRTNTRTTARPTAETDCAGHHGVQSGIDTFVGPILVAVAGFREFLRPFKSPHPWTLRA